MSIESIASQVKNAEQYVIRSPKSEHVSSEQTSQASQTSQSAQTDEYDKSNPVGETVEGIYSVSKDDEGNLKVNYTQPSEKASQTGVKADAKADAGAKAGAGAGASSSTSTASEDSDDDDEIETLKKQRDQIKAQLNRETDEEAKRALRVQLQNIEAQIAMKSAESIEI